MNVSLYVASKSELGPMWRSMRTAWAFAGINVVSTWIDESGEGQTSDFSDLWMRCIAEASQADAVLALHRPGDVWKGAFVEIGAALAAGRRVLVFGDPPGSWVAHPSVRRIDSLDVPAIRKALR